MKVLTKTDRQYREYLLQNLIKMPGVFIKIFKNTY